MTTDQYRKRELNKQFADHLLNDDALTLAIEWIRDNIDPKDVFEIKTLENWCQENSTPADTFTDAQLEEWARENDFVTATDTDD